MDRTSKDTDIGPSVASKHSEESGDEGSHFPNQRCLKTLALCVHCISGARRTFPGLPLHLVSRLGVSALLPLSHYVIYREEIPKDVPPRKAQLSISCFILFLPVYKRPALVRNLTDGSSIREDLTLRVNFFKALLVIGISPSGPFWIQNRKSHLTSNKTSFETSVQHLDRARRQSVYAEASPPCNCLPESFEPSPQPAFNT